MNFAVCLKGGCLLYTSDVYKRQVIDEYSDDGWSGTNFDRPDFQRMIDDIEDGKIKMCIRDRSNSNFTSLSHVKYSSISSTGSKVKSILTSVSYTHLPLPLSGNLPTAKRRNISCGIIIPIPSY